MADPLIITMLSTKRTELAGAILDLERQIGVHKANLGHVDATLRLFDPQIVPATIKAKGRKPGASLFPLGDVSEFVLDTLRTAPNPVSSRELTEGLMVKKGLGPCESHTRDAVLIRVRNALSAHRRRGVLESVGEGWHTRWKVA